MGKQGALSGIKVLDLSRLLPGPYCSMILADHGARVIAVEDKRFKQDNLFLHSIYRNKEHISLNLKTPKGLEIFLKLARNADVLIEGFRPKVVDRLGIDYLSIQEVNPQIIYCSITGYGQTGPYKDKAGHDINYLSAAGVMDMIGNPGDSPNIPGIQIADLAGGGLNGALGIILALFARKRDGKGQYIDISMTDGSLSLLPLVLHFRNINGQSPTRGDWLFSHRYACYNIYETADGRYISVGALEHRFWENLCQHLDFPEYINLQYSQEKRTEIIQAISKRFKQKTLEQWEKELSETDTCCQGIRTLEEVLHHPLFKQREMVFDSQGPDGKSEFCLGVPVKLSQTPGYVRRPPKKFGQDTLSILSELNYSQAEIDDFMQEEVI